MHNTIHHTTHHRIIATLLPILLLVSILAGCGASQKVYHIGILSGLDFFANSIDGFKSKMTELGYIEGKNVVYDIQKTNLEPEKENTILVKFISDHVDLIFVFPTEASLEAKQATAGTNIPVVFANAIIDGVPLIDTVRAPGGNITGVNFPGPQLDVKRLELLHELAPKAKRIWITYLKGYPSVAPGLDALRPAAESLGLNLVEVPATGIPDVQRDLDARAKQSDIGIDAMLLLVEPLGVDPNMFGVAAKFADAHKLPIGGADIISGEYRSLFGLIPDNVESGKQAAILADRIFKGTRAGTVPVVTPDNVFTLNYKQAQALGLPVSDGLLKLANQIIR